MPKRAAKTKRVPSQLPDSPFSLKDETVERWIKTGEQPGLLEDYFGRQNYQELRELSLEAAARRRGGPRVLILPGIMGSTLGRPGAVFDDVIWIDPIDIARGNIEQLRLNGGAPKIEALGVVLLAYLRLKLKLTIAGFDADFFPFDWRRSIDHLATALARRLEVEAAPEIHLVAHSMGGLVARAAIAKGAPKVVRLIMLGTPNFGSFVPIQALRGTYPIVRKVAAVDLTNTAEELAERVFATFPSLYQMMPSPAKFDAVRLSEIDSWPKSGPRPLTSLLKEVGGVSLKLATPQQRNPFFMIAGVRQETLVGVRANHDEFQYEFSKDGDGTVPLSLAELPGATTFYVEESHGSLPNNGPVAAAVAEILNTGKTSVLTAQRPAPSRDGRRVVTERELRALEAEAPRPRILSQREKRRLLEEVASPDAKAREMPVTALPPSAPAAGPVGQQTFDRVVIGRRLQHRLDLKLVCGSITDVDARAYVLGFFRDVTPSGAARDIDARLDGAITEFTTRRMFSGHVGEIFMMPAGRHAIRTDTIVFAGLGLFDAFDREVQQLVSENVVRTLVRTRVEEFATVFLGGGSGRSPASSLQSMIEGFLRGLRDADSGQRFRSIILCEIDRGRYDAMRAELYRLLGTSLFEDFEITLDEEAIPPAEAAPAVRAGARRRDPVYLLVRQEGEEEGDMLLRTSLLTAGEKAAVVSESCSVSPAGLDRHLAKLQSSRLTMESMAAFGAELGKLVVPADIRALLYTMRDRHLVVVHDAPASRIPWETLSIESRDGGSAWSPAAEAGMSRRYTADNLSIAKWLEQRRRDKTLQVLLVVNPTEDLPGAEAEGRRILELVQSHPSVSVNAVRGADATKNALSQFFRSGDYDVVHYAGHAFFNPARPSESGMICAGRQVLSGRDLAGVGNLPSLVFFNACEAARVRKASPMRSRVERSVGMAEAFLRGGVANYVGTYWPVGDEAASVFANAFYTGLLQGATIGDALLAGRRKVAAIQSIDWADYVHYGDYEFALKENF